MRYMYMDIKELAQAPPASPANILQFLCYIQKSQEMKKTLLKVDSLEKQETKTGIHTLPQQ